MKRFIKPLVVLSISAVLLGVAVYLHSIDNPAFYINNVEDTQWGRVSNEAIIATPQSVPTFLPPGPPWYASLWPIFLAGSIIGLLYLALAYRRSIIP